MVTRRPAEVFPPGDFIREELEAREWTQGDLAEIMGKSQRLVSEIISGKRCITPETAKSLGLAFGTSAEYWMNLDSAYQLSKVESKGDEIVRRALLFEHFPVKEMIKRHWIEHSQSLDVLEERFKQFFEVDSLDERPVFLPYAAKKSVNARTESTALNAWLFRTRQLARELEVEDFSRKALNSAISDLREWMADLDCISKIPSRLAQAGVRFVVVEAFPGMKLDGVCYWLSKKEPVVAMTTRMDRVDNFWFVLMHELRHVANGDSLSLDENLGSGPIDEPCEDCPEQETRANNEAAETILPRAELRSFIQSAAPGISAKKILAFAASRKLHSGILVGQLQHVKAIPYSHHRKHLEKVRDRLIKEAMTDGWGSQAV